MLTWLLFQISLINFLYAVAGLVLLAVTAGLFFDYYANEQKWYKAWVVPYVWAVIALATFGGVATTLLYSEVFGFVPCSLCWLQRIALYPQVILMAVAYKRRDTKHFPFYGIALSIFGLLVAIYQYIDQLIPQTPGKQGILPCLADGSADCSKKIIDLFGFVTFPFLSAVLFLFLIVVYLHLSRQSRER